MKSWTQTQIQSTLIRYSPWAAVFFLPLIVNVFVWRHFVLPEQAKLQEWRSKQQSLEIKPRLEALLLEVHQQLREWEEAGFVKDDVSRAMEVIEKIAAHQRVEIKGIRIKEGEFLKQAKEKAGSSAEEMTTLDLNLDVNGNFDKLARWISAVETRSGLQIRSWSLTSSKGAGPSHRLGVTITVFLRGA